MRPDAEIGLSDTTGRAHPVHVDSLFAARMARFPLVSVSPLQYDPYAFGRANVRVLSDAGCACSIRAVSALGVCPFAQGATGNVAIEDFAWMFGCVGVATGMLSIPCSRGRPTLLPGGEARDALTRRQSACLAAAGS